jgi:peptidoglycan/LPS O-acetylase OafA/YrhL
MFGAVRFGARALAESASIPAYGNRARWVLLGFLIGAIALASVQEDSPNLSAVFEVSATCLAVAGAVLAADIVIGRHRVERAKKIDWIGAVALLAGLATPLYMPLVISAAPESWWHPWLLPSCGMGFLVCLASGAVQKMSS